MKVTTTMHAYLAAHATLTPHQLQTPAGASQLTYVAAQSKYWAEHGYTYIGEAEVTVEVPDVRELVDNKIESLRSQAIAIRAEATAKCTAIEGQIQNLLAIEHTPAADQAGAEA